MQEEFSKEVRLMEQFHPRDALSQDGLMTLLPEPWQPQAQQQIWHSAHPARLQVGLPEPLGNHPTHHDSDRLQTSGLLALGSMDDAETSVPGRLGTNQYFHSLPPSPAMIPQLCLVPVPMPSLAPPLRAHSLSIWRNINPREQSLIRSGIQGFPGLTWC